MKQVKQGVVLNPEYTSELKLQLKQKCIQYGDFKFEEDIWYCRKLHKSSDVRAKFTLSFDFVDEEYKEILKFYALSLSDAISGIDKKIKSLNIFLNYLFENFPDYKLKNVNRKIINSFEEYIKLYIQESHKKKMIYGSLINFFQVMVEFPELPDYIPTKRRNPFKQNTSKDELKYIPEEVTKRFDQIMKDENNGIPLEFRVLYWLIRSFPNRITEVCSMKIDCLKPLYSYYVINVPTWKQNGGYIIEEIKTIPILNTGHGKYIIGLIKRLQKLNRERLEYMSVEDRCKNFLFLFPYNYKFYDNGYSVRAHSPVLIYGEILKIVEKFPSITVDEIQGLLESKDLHVSKDTIKKYLKKPLDSKYYKYWLTSMYSTRVNLYLDRIIKIFKIKDKNGDTVSLSSHQFRHNATTDRAYLGGYTAEQLRHIRNDKGERMFMQYVHQLKDQHKRMWMDATGLTGPLENPVEFNGLIMNLNDPVVAKRLSANPQAYLTWEANGKKGVGMCSNIVGCNPKGTSVHFECYECDWFVPKAEYYDDYKVELEYWKNIMESEATKLNRAAHFENAIRNVNCLERILKIIENGIEKYKREIEQKIGIGEMEVALS